MTEYIVANILTHEFEERLHLKWQSKAEKPKMMHIAIHLHPKGKDQYEVHHMYLYAPMNYVYVAVQEERIDAKGNRVVGKMKILCYHDSCWRDAVQRFIFENRDRLSSFRAYNNLFDWYDVLEITAEEVEYLRQAEFFAHSLEGRGKEFTMANPFDKRGIWKD